MATATVQMLIDEGWRREQFGGAMDWHQFKAYLTSLLTEAGQWVVHHVGATVYNSLPTGYIENTVARAELCYCAARLWRRRAAFFDASGTQDLQSPAYTERREYLAHAKEMQECATTALIDAMRALGLSTDGLGADWTGISARAVESGPYPPQRLLT